MSVRADGSFAEDLPPGIYTLTVESRALQEVLAVVSGIEVRPGEVTDDPRLAPIDVRGRARPIRVEVVAPDAGEAVEGDCTWREVGGAARGGGHVEAGALALTLGRHPLELWIVCPGYRLVHLPSVAGDARVQLEPAPPLRLRLPADLRLPATPRELLATLYPPEPWSRSQLARGRFDGARSLLLPGMGVGRCGVALLLRDPRVPHGGDLGLGGSHGRSSRRAGRGSRPSSCRSTRGSSTRPWRRRTS